MLITRAGQVLFAVSLVALLWTYLLYPLTIWALARLRARPWKLAPFTGRVTLVIPAHNEAKVIRRKIENALALDPGPARLEIVVVSDGSLDGTEAILDEYRAHPAAVEGRLKLLAYQPRGGKPHALHRAVELAGGEVLVFTDANVYLDRSALQQLLAPFADESVGAVCGKVFVAAHGDEIGGESLYMRYEGLAQRAEARVWSTIGVDGALYALRRPLYRRLEPDVMLDDLALSMEVLAAGLRIAYVEEASAVEEVVASAADEFKRKKRIVSGGYQFFSRFVARHGRLGAKVWLMFLSHKMLRWFSPLFLLGALAGNIMALGTPGAVPALTAQLALYLLALAGALVPSLRTVRPVYVPYYFCVINLAALAGLVMFLRARQSTLWEKVER